MSDFFTRLAERTLGLALIIQPIKPSLFAPESASGDETLLAIDEESETSQAFSDTPPISEWSEQQRATEISTVQAEQSSSAAIHNRQSLDALPINSMNGTGPRDDLARNKLVGVQRRVPTTKPRSSDTTQARELTTNMQEINSTTRPSGPHASTVAIPQTYREAPETVVSSTLTEQVHGHDTAKGSTRSDSNIALERHTETSTLLREQQAAPHAILGERSWRSPQLPVFTSTERTLPEASATEPAIQVTIGRVEVRAVTTPARTDSSRPPARSTTSHPMSLDEYLRSQEQGGRR